MSSAFHLEVFRRAPLISRVHNSNGRPASYNGIVETERRPMIDSIVNLLFRCPHKRITRPITPVSKGGVAQGDTYVVCLDCGKQFAYDLQRMRIDKPVKISEASGVLQHDMPKPRKSKLKV